MTIWNKVSYNGKNIDILYNHDKFSPCDNVIY